jgi:hypothetical protein
MRVRTPNYITLFCQERYKHVVAYVLDPTKVDIPVLAIALNCSTLSVLCAMACSPAALRSHRVGACRACRACRRARRPSGT